MSFGEALRPSKQTRTAFAVSATLFQRDDSPLKLAIGINAPLFRDLGEPDRVDVHPGAGTDHGRVRLVFSETGAFPISCSRPGKSGGRFELNTFDSIPGSHCFQATPCKIILHEDNVLIVELPLAEWKAQL